MCALNILLLITEIASLINDIMRANFIENDAVLDSEIKSLPWSDKIATEPSNEIPDRATPQEISNWAQRAFLLLCDLYCIDSFTPADENAVKQTSVYLRILEKNVSTMPSFLQANLDPVAERSYMAAVEALERRQWFSLKGMLVTCRSLIYQSSSTPPASQASTNIPYDFKDWNAVSSSAGTN